jgi:hypothetical protein
MSKLASLGILGLLAVSGTAALAERPAVFRPVAVRANPDVARHRPDGVTRSEAARLRYQYSQLQLMKRKAAADGDVTRREQARIEHQQKKLRRLLNIAKNN